MRTIIWIGFMFVILELNPTAMSSTLSIVILVFAMISDMYMTSVKIKNNGRSKD